MSTPARPHLICPHCQERLELAPGESFCPHCGQALPPEAGLLETTARSHSRPELLARGLGWGIQQTWRYTLAWLAAYLLIIPFLPLLIGSLAELARGQAFDNGVQNTLTSGLVGSAVCCYFLFSPQSWPATKQIWAWRNHRRLYSALAVLALASPFVVVWAIHQQSQTDKAEAAIRHRLGLALVAANVGAGGGPLSDPRSYESTSQVLKALTATARLDRLRPTTGPAGQGQVSVLVGAGGAQVVLTTPGVADCIVVVETLYSLPASLPGTLTEPGVWTMTWSPGLHDPPGCQADRLPARRSNGGYGLLGGGHWHEGGLPY